MINQMSLVASFEVVDHDEFHATSPRQNNFGGEDFSEIYLPTTYLIIYLL